MKRTFLLVALLLSLVLGVSAGQVATAATEDLFFSEYVEGGANNKALEIYNGTGAPVDLAAGGYSVVMYFNGNSNPELTIPLTGTVASGDVYVLANGASDPVVVAEADQTHLGNWYNGDDLILLTKGAIGTVDSIGQYQTDPGTEYGAGDTSTADNTLRRMSTVCAGDTVTTDPFDPAVEWIGYPVDTFDGLGSHTAYCAPPAVVINEMQVNTDGTDWEFVELYGTPGADLSDVALIGIESDFGSATGTIDRVISLSGQTIPGDGIWVGMSPAGAAAYGIPGDMAIPDNSFENGTATYFLVYGLSASAGLDLDANDDNVLDLMPWVTVLDSVNIRDSGADDFDYEAPRVGPGGTFQPAGVFRCPDGPDGVFDGNFLNFDVPDGTPGTANRCEVCGGEFTPVYDIQGSGSASPLAGSLVSTEGVVVGDFQDNDGDEFDTDLDGFFIQDPAGDGDPATSDGIFVYAPGQPDLVVGDHVRVRGVVEEFNSLTEITGVSQLWVCGTGSTLAPTAITLPLASADEFEPYEGMLVTFPETLVISEYFNFDRFNEIVLTAERQFQPTAVYEPGSPEADALLAENLVRRITLDDGRSEQNPDPARHPNGMEFTLDNRFRGGDTVTNLTGVLDYSFGIYRIQPTEGADYAVENPRPAAPADVGGSVTVASFNVLNYFLTLDNGVDDICGPLQDQECRGADTAEEFARQRAKILAALEAIDADVFGLIEMENTPDIEPLADLVAGLNDLMGAGTYDYVDTGVIGTDAIRVGIIYKPGTVTLTGDIAVLEDEAFVNPLGGDLDRNRPAVVASFTDENTGGVFTVAVNHLKSKGSSCPEETELDPLQGECNQVRTLAAGYLVDWLATDPTGSGSENTLIIGDLNAYDKEDPIDVVLLGPDDTPSTGDDYVDLLYHYIGELAYSYLFSGQLGYLDHALANMELLPYVTGATVWHINADEVDLIDYDMSFKQDPQDALYAPDPYRSSDHDPVIVGLAVCDADSVGPTLEVSVAPDVLSPVTGELVTVEASLTVSDDFDAEPEVTLVSITSSDPGGEDDIVIVDVDTFQLRAELTDPQTARTYTITYEATDACGNTTTVTTTVTVPPAAVCETVPPVLEVAVSPENLWPPTGELVTVEATITVSDNEDPNPVVTLVSVTSSQSGGNEDIVIVDDDTFQLRAEWTGNSAGRVYTIIYRATDACGNATAATAQVTVMPPYQIYLPVFFNE